MICNTCGRQTQNETANFCEYCGASFREQGQREPNFGLGSNPGFGSNPGSGQPPYNRGMMPGSMNSPMGGSFAQPTQQSDTEKPISFLNWLGSYALLMVPFVNIIMLFIWAFSYNTPASKKNWARVTLIAGVVLFLLFMVYMGYIMSTPVYQQMFQQMMQEYGYSTGY